jgi:PleD family two-component response regulator
MILAAVDDLMFVSKISAAAKQRGLQVSFSRSADDTLQQAQTAKPGLIIFDLNSTRLDPLRTVSALKADGELGAIRTLGFVSHVQADVIAAARAAGVDEVLARSAFTARVGEILAGA